LPILHATSIATKVGANPVTNQPSASYISIAAY
jgi:hypothetical protein